MGSCLLLLELLLQELLKLGKGMVPLGRGGPGADSGGEHYDGGGGGAARGHAFGDLLQARLALLAAAAWRAQRGEGGGTTAAAAGGGQDAMEVDGGAGGRGGGAAGERRDVGARGLGWRLLGFCWEHLFEKPVQVRGKGGQMSGSCPNVS